MRYGLLVFSVCALSLVPTAVFARVTINEVAWMGTDEGGANCEWIELHTDSASVIDLSGWTLTIENAGSVTPKVLDLSEVASVKYSGIAENGYYLIARNSGDCGNLVPGTSADWLGSFGAGISNSGAILTLKNGVDEEDVVNSKTGWETSKGGVGGKNTSGKSKETPQRQGESWITATPTPRSPNHSAPLEEVVYEPDATTTPVVTIGGTAPLVPVINPVPKFYVDGGPARIVLAGADTTFTAFAYDSVGTVRRNAKISWSFGDGGDASGEEVFYAYTRPGTYTAVVRARDKGASTVTLIPVSVIAPSVTIAEVTEDGVVLVNEGEQLADLSSWKLGTGRKARRLPPDTVIAAGGTVFFSYDALRLASSTEVELSFPNGKLAYAYTQPGEETTGLEQVQVAVPARTLAVNPGHTYANGDPAPAAQVILTAAGAPVATSTEEEPTVILAKKQSIFSTVQSLLSSVFLYASDTFPY